MNGENLNISVEMSRKWDAYEAGIEIAKSLVRNNSQIPKFILIFSTIHYKKYGGFDELLRGINDYIPQKIPIAGGTVAGFMNREGAFSRGAVAVSFSGNINVNDLYAKGTRKNPKKIIEQIKNRLINKEDSLVMAFLPGPSMPNVKKGKKLIVTKSKTLADMAPKLLKISTTKFNKGVGREMEVLENLSQIIKSDIVGCSTIDDNTYDDNFQFLNGKSYSDSLVLLEIDKIRYDLDTIGMMPIPKNWHNVNRKKTFGHILEKVEDESALSFYTRTLGYNSELIFDEPDLVHRRFVFAPVLTKDEYGGIHPRCPGTFYGNKLGFGHPIFESVGISLTDGKYVNNQFFNFINKFKEKKISFLLIFSCAVLFEALGIGIFKIYEEIIKNFKNDFLIVFGGGEIIAEKNREKGPKILEMSLTGVGFH